MIVAGDLFINPPIGLVGVVLGIFLLPRRDRPERLAFDVGGMITEMIGFGAVLYAASIAADQRWSSPGVLLCFAVGVVGLLLFGVVELRFARNPLLNLRLFRKRVFTNANLLGYVTTVALFGVEFVLRNRVERLINRLKQFRRLATRYEKRAENHRAMWLIAATVLWL